MSKAGLQKGFWAAYAGTAASYEREARSALGSGLGKEDYFARVVLELLVLLREVSPEVDLVMEFAGFQTSLIGPSIPNLIDATSLELWHPGEEPFGSETKIWSESMAFKKKAPAAPDAASKSKQPKQGKLPMKIPDKGGDPSIPSKGKGTPGRSAKKG